jgi:hypothetical protein
MSLPSPTPTTTAVVTGASSGIGADIARELVSRGHGVTLVARREDRLRALAEELGGSVRVEILACDIADATQRAELLDEVARRGLTVDILINNAGVGMVSAVACAPVPAEIGQVRLNVEAVVDLTTRAVQQMVPRGRGAILNVGSGSAYYPTPGQAGYAATKAFVHSYSQAAKAELHGTGVTVTVVNPGPVRTEILAAAGIDESVAAAMMPSILYMDSREVARIAIDALASGKAVVVPGYPTRFAMRILSRVPRRILLPALAKRNPILQSQKG